MNGHGAMHISDIELFNLASASAPPARWQTLFCLTTTDGRQGWGEAQLGWRREELAQRRQWLLSSLAGHSIYNVAELAAGQSMEPDLRDNRPLRFAIETALWDVVGKSLGQPLCNLWGGMYRSQIPLAVRIDADVVLANPGAAGELIEHGFRHLVLACSGDEERDTQAVLALQQSIGWHASLGIDGQSQYTPDGALRLSSSLPAGAVTTFLDPVAGDDLPTVCSLAQIMNTPIALCRALHSASQVMALIRGGSVHNVIIDPSRVGGLLAARRCIAVATAGGLATSLYFVRSVGAASAAALHVAASIVELDRHHLLESFETPASSAGGGIEITGGAAAAPQAPGLGIRVDRDALELTMGSA